MEVDIIFIDNFVNYPMGIFEIDHLFIFAKVIGSSIMFIYEMFVIHLLYFHFIINDYGLN